MYMYVCIYICIYIYIYIGRGRERERNREREEGGPVVDQPDAAVHGQHHRRARRHAHGHTLFGVEVEGWGLNYSAATCSDSEAGSYLRLIDFVYHSTLGLRVIKKKMKVTLSSVLGFRV